MWIKNTSGKADAMLTFALIAFIVTTLNVLLSTVGTISTDNFSLSFQPLEAAIMSTYLGVAFSAYVGRRWTDKKYIGSDYSSDQYKYRRDDYDRDYDRSYDRGYNRYESDRREYDRHNDHYRYKDREPAPDREEVEPPEPPPSLS